MTKIMCTLGNTTDSEETISRLIKAGMNAARINTAYCSFKDYEKRINLVRSEASKLNANIPIIMDLKGPQLRIITQNPSLRYSIEKGIVFPIGFFENKNQLKREKETEIYLNYDIKKDLEEGDTILMENGTIVTRVIENNSKVYLEIINEGEGIIKNHMGANVPGKYLNLPALSRRDKALVDFCLRENVECVALSFVRSENDISELKNFIQERKVIYELNYNPKIMAKIEEKNGFQNLEKIIEVGKENFSVMIARGDLYNEMNYAKLAKIQSDISKRCKEKNIELVIGTGFLESMKYERRPTRAEICDVWNALRENPAYIMLSAETSNSKYPVLAVNTLSQIIEEYYK